VNGHHYPDHFYADALARDEKPLGAYRSADPVTKPAHYQRAGIETIDYIRATLDGPGFEAYCIGNVLKYVSRYREKGGIEDLRKAQVYLGWAIQPVDGKRQSQPEGCNPAAMREALGETMTPDRIAKVAAGNPATVPGYPVEGVPPERVPKWHRDWPDTPPNCDGLSARDVSSPHPMQAETLREFERDDNASGV
jgi:hypothetical protein